MEWDPTSLFPKIRELGTFVDESLCVLTRLKDVGPWKYIKRLSLEDQGIFQKLLKSQIYYCIHEVLNETLRIYGQIVDYGSEGGKKRWNALPELYRKIPERVSDYTSLIDTLRTMLRVTVVDEEVFLDNLKFYLEEHRDRALKVHWLTFGISIIPKKTPCAIL